MYMYVFDHVELSNLSLFDANCHLGHSEVTSMRAPVSPLQLLQEMDRCGIAEALVYHASAALYAPVFGNNRLLEETTGKERLHLCWVALPHQTREIGAPTDFIEQLSAAGVRAVRMFPSRFSFSLSDWSIAELLMQLDERQIPLFLDFERSHWAENVVSYDEVYRICKEYRHLPVILVREGIGSTRYLYPLFEKCENLRIEISYYQAASGLEDITQRFGVKRLLFGTGLPIYSAGPAITMLLHSDLSIEEKRMIGGDNLRELLGAVNLEK